MASVRCFFLLLFLTPHYISQDIFFFFTKITLPPSPLSHKHEQRSHASQAVTTLEKLKTEGAEVTQKAAETDVVFEEVGELGWGDYHQTYL